jgi:hypothetical protein
MQLEQLPPRFCTDMKKTKTEAKISKVMREYGAGKLHSGSKKGPAVTSKKQAIAIALSEAGMSKPMKKKK